jgi:hypothetical protein
MHAHPAMGERVVASIPALSHLARAVRAEHERWDGTGYPDGLARDAIPLASRICLVCDAWHAMTSHRPYRGALTEGEARAELIRNAGTQFCPRTTDALLTVRDLSFSCGVASLAPGQRPADDFRAADAAQYAAKRAGRGLVALERAPADVRLERLATALHRLA